MWIDEREVTRRELLSYELPDLDARVAGLLPEPGEPASRALLYSLVEHPRVQTVSGMVQVEKVQVGLVAEERLGSVMVNAGIEGATLPPYLAERVRKAKPEELVFLWDEGKRTLTLLEVKPELRRRSFRCYRRRTRSFHPRVTARCSNRCRSGHSGCPSRCRAACSANRWCRLFLPVLRLEARPNGAVEFELRVRALPDGPAMLPGDGGRDVHLRRGDKAVHAVRDSASRGHLRERADRRAASLEGRRALRALSLPLRARRRRDDAARCVRAKSDAAGARVGRHAAPQSWWHRRACAQGHHPQRPRLVRRARRAQRRR